MKRDYSLENFIKHVARINQHIIWDGLCGPSEARSALSSLQQGHEKVIKNFNVPMLDARGRKIGVDGEVAKEGQSVLLLADVAISACQNPCEGDDKLSMSAKIKLGSLAARIGEATGDNPGIGPREYEQSELDTIKERGVKNVQIMAFYRLQEMIDAPESKLPKDSPSLIMNALAAASLPK
jgi:hypothetical protein